MLSACGAVSDGAAAVADGVDDLVDQSVMSIEVGLCFDDEGAEDEVSSVPDRECDEPHDNEVFAIYDLPSGDYPGDQEVQSMAQEYCVGSAFTSYVGIEYADSDLDVFTLTPTAEGWEQGDQEVICALYALNRSKLDASMKGSNR
jgi:hypothetical protein